MELSLQKNPVFINEPILEETAEISVECDALLPDYCPDIRRILKCTMTPVVMSRSITAGRLSVEGLATLHILYLSAGGELAKGEYKVPFSRMLELRGEAENPLITVTLHAGQVNCRAVSQRRLDIRGTVILHASGVTCREEQMICGSGEESLQLRRVEKKGMRLAAQAEKEQRLTQTMPLSGNGAPISRVLRCGAHIAKREEKMGDARLTVRGEVAVSALVANEDGGWEKAEATLPYELSLELPGASAETPCEVWQEIISATAEPGTDADGEYRTLCWDVTLATRARLYRPYSSCCCTDCYSTKYASTCHSRSMPILRLHSLCGEGESYRTALPLPEEMQEIAALWGTEEGCAVHAEGDGLLAEGKLALTMLCRMADGELASFDRTLELSHHTAAPEGALWNARLECRSLQWEVQGGELTLSCELWWSGAVCMMTKETMLDEITVDEKRPRMDSMPRGLYIYMAGEGENLWEVAKRYNTSMEKIRADNGDMGEECAGGAILIPV